MAEAFVAGVFAGYGVAVPVGAIAILIIEASTRRGFGLGASAGAGAATADGLYALLAALFGVALAAAVTPLVGPLRAVAVLVLVAIAARGLAGLRNARSRTIAGPAPDPDGGPGTLGTYGRFLGLTLLNPMTVIYFGALIVGLPSTGEGTAAKAAFVVGAFLASLSWQTLLAAFGALLHRRASPALSVGVSVVGYLIVLGFAARIALDLLAG